MRSILHRHPQSHGGASLRVEAEARRTSGGMLALSYAVNGAVEGLKVAAPAAPERTDGLWRTTCFEAFVTNPENQGYAEINLAPSTQWAAYAFSGYREGMRPAPLPTPRIITRLSADRFELEAVLDLGGLPELGAQAWRAGLTAVLEDSAGAISYWALAHPTGKPDFHHSDGFVLDLPSTEHP